MIESTRHRDNFLKLDIFLGVLVAGLFALQVLMVLYSVLTNRSSIYTKSYQAGTPALAINLIVFGL